MRTLFVPLLLWLAVGSTAWSQVPLSHRPAVLALTLQQSRNYTPESVITACDEQLKQITDSMADVQTRLFVLRGDAYLRGKDVRSAAQSYQAAVEADASSIEGRVGLLVCAAQSGRLVFALRELRKLQSDVPPSLELLTKLMLVEMTAGDVAAAEATATQAIEVDPTCFEAVFTRALIHFQQQKFEESLSDANDLLLLAKFQSPEEFAKVLQLRADAALKLGRTAAAERDLLQAVRMHPKNSQAISKLWFLAWKSQQFDLAANWADYLRNVDPDAIGTFKICSTSYLKCQRFEDAESALRDWEKHAPTNPERLFKLGYLQFRRGQHRESLATLEQALKARPTDSELLGIMIVILTSSADEELRDATRAGELLERYRRLERRADRVQFLEAQVLAANGKFDEAVERVESSLAADQLTPQQRTFREKTLEAFRDRQVRATDGSDLETTMQVTPTKAEK